MCYTITMKPRFLVAIVLALAPTPVFATEPDLSDAQRGAISQNCQSIKSSLKSLQQSDSRTRVILGGAYQTIITDFVTPLNVRLVKNNQVNSTLSTIQSNLATEREKFNQQFIKYSQALEALINIDCQAHPDEFYQQLTATRTERAKLNKLTSTLNQLTNQHLTAVTALRDNLKKEANV